ncbi:LacI family DNA-binding transcriptional regulator [Gracilinema caldarium]|uniref:Transcriptional regulator, LacI family n=1 Tax=Gracilinema caldarium (strain ATCC 51460 / DSM 7334 / H1) TaxID=744872 RepID=F8EY68_GRAC1|nr:LacI family DNA-binding transcriptional regulator [Gracilinema caldarium]AEJ18227.1 transcriptional regulator, LacI family [Gracilinema caldarium DSM 7334]
MTVKEIAKLAGVSIGTVDRVLHGRGRVSPETKARIEEIIKKSGFTPNPIARGLKRSRPFAFVALLPQRDQDSGYWGQGYGGLQSASEELSPLGIKTIFIEYDRYNPASFHDAVYQFNKLHCDGLLLPPIMPEESRVFVESIQGKIPYIYYDADLPGTEPLCVIGQDAFRGGMLAGRLAQLLACGKRGAFGILVAHQEDYHILRRRDGFYEYAHQHGLKVFQQQGVDLEHPEAASTLIKNLLDTHEDLLGVFVTSASAHRIAEAAREIRKNNHFIIIGYDLVPENHRLLQEGALDAIISQRPETQARRGLLQLYRAIVLGKSIPKREEIPLDLYLPENVPPYHREATTHR